MVYMILKTGRKEMFSFVVPLVVYQQWCRRSPDMIADVCANRPWLHADGANGAVGRMFLPEHMYKRIGSPDSITLDPTTSGCLSFECAACGRDPKCCADLFDDAPYLAYTAVRKYWPDYSNMAPRCRADFGL